MNTQEKQKLYKKILRVRRASPSTFAPHGYLRDHHPKLLEQVQSRFDIKIAKAEHLFQFLNPHVKPCCKVCGKPTKFESFELGFKSWCSTSCVQNSPDIRSKKEQTNLERRGVKWPTQSAGVLKKVRKTVLKRFGHEHAAQSPRAKLKSKKTNQRRYGVDHPQQTSEVRAKVMTTNLKKTNGKYTTPFQDPQSMALAKETMIQRYGVAHTSQSHELREKIERTMVKRWGVRNASQSEQVKAKKIETSRKHYGTDYPMQHPDVLARAQKTLFRTYEMKVGRRTLILQGYEDMAINSLRSIGVPASKIQEASQSFRYSHQKKWHVYHPDFEIAHAGHRIMVEVKSTFTAGIQVTGKLLPEVLAKAKAVVQDGRPLLLLVMRPLDSWEADYVKGAPKGTRKGRITHFTFSTPKRPDWTLYSKKVDKKELKARIQAWLAS